MSCCEVSGTNERIAGTGCCGSTCSGGKRGCLASEPRIRSCLCQANLGCLEPSDCGGFRPRGTAATGACPGPCQCAEEDAWNRNVPPKPNCEWLSNFSELRRQWSDHSRQQNCKCCNCRPCRKAVPRKPYLSPTSSYSGNSISSSRDCQDCCKERLTGGGSASRPNNSSSSSPHTCPPANYNSQTTHSRNKPHSSAHQYSQPSPQVDWPPSSYKPCSPSPRHFLKKRSCCQCVPGYCMCQPLPRSCNCPPPVYVDARAERECSCDCPSSPECACPPSERRFPRTKIKCPNAKMCCPLPRLTPGPKCVCSECQPCLPPPCDPCTSTKCKTIPSKMNPCKEDSPSPISAHYRPGSSTRSEPYRSEALHSLLPCASCRKMSPSLHGNFRDEPLPSQVHILNRARASNSRPGQSPGSDDARDGDEDGVVEAERPHKCNCGSKCMGYGKDRNFCCSLNCAEAAVSTYDVGLKKEVEMNKRGIKFSSKSLLNPKFGDMLSRTAKSKLRDKINSNSRVRNSWKRSTKLLDSDCTSSLVKSSSSAVRLDLLTSGKPGKLNGFVPQKAKVEPTSSVMIRNDSCPCSTPAATPIRTMPKIRLYDRLQAQTKRLNPFSKIRCKFS